MSEPKPCPFCGHVGLDFREGSTFRWIIAECAGCGAGIGETRIQTLGDGTKEEWMAIAQQDAIEAWNRRAALAAQPRAVGEWRRVPVDPTVQMAQALIDYKGDDEMQWPSHVSPNFALAAYRIMLAAAPTEAKPAQDAVDAERWRAVRKHWKNAKFTYRKDAANLLKTITLLIDFDHETGRGATVIERDFDAAISAKKVG